MPETSGSFRVSLPGVAPGEDVLGVWQAQAAPEAGPAAGARSFGGPVGLNQAPPAGEAEYTLWQVDLPPDPRQAGRLIAGHELRLEQAGQALEQAERRLGRYIDLRQQGGGAAAFGLFSGAESVLNAWLAPGGAPTALEIPGFLNLPGDWEAGFGQANALLKRVSQAATYAAWVETSSAGGLVGRTLVGWDGDLAHSWLQNTPAVLAGQHQRSLALALRSRLAWIKMVMVVLSGGLKLAALAPAGPVAAIPAAFQFVRLVIAQAQDIQAIHSENQEIRT